MDRIDSTVKYCQACMQEHEIAVVKEVETTIFKSVEVTFSAAYEYCENTDTLLETEELIRINDVAMKDQYRIQEGLLTSQEIINLRDKYKISQKDLSEILGWGHATIARYETHQVQDKAHDLLFRVIRDDPGKFLDYLHAGKGRIAANSYRRSHHAAMICFADSSDYYLRQSIQAEYAAELSDKYTGNTKLNLDKVVEMINYLSNKVQPLYSVKMAKLLWYSDATNYIRYNSSISGLVYHAQQYGALPRAYWNIISLKGIQYEKTFEAECATKFSPVSDFVYKFLSEEEKRSIDLAVSVYGFLSNDDIVEKMHQEKAYKNTRTNGLISFEYTNELVDYERLTTK